MMDDYQRLIEKFDLYPEAVKKLIEYNSPENVERSITTLLHFVGLTGEVGELGEKIKKTIRDGTLLDHELIAKELGDIEWYLTRLETDFGFRKQEIIEKNIAKLNKRLEKNKLHGEGDNREENTT